jgi:radical SAM protein with 4Fe4S-binding SPASM domain
LIPEGSEYEQIASQAVALGIRIVRFNTEQVREKPLYLRQQRWALEDDSGNETWVGSAFAQAMNDNWDTAILVPLCNLLVEPEAVFASLALYRRESFDVCFVEERVPGAGWTVFSADLLRGLQKSHEDIMWARGGLSWALRKPLYPFKTGYFHCPRVRASIRADLRLNSKRSAAMYAQLAFDRFAETDFSYAAWLADSGWEELYTDFAPAVLIVEPTTECAGKCFNCGRNNLGREKAELDAGLFASMVDEFSAHREVRFVFTGMGEPLLHPDFSEMLHSTRNFVTSLHSSLQVMPPPDFPFTALDHLRISVDALEADGFSLSRDGCCWQNIEGFIAMLREYRKNDAERFPEIGVSFLLTRLTENQQQAFINYWKKVVRPVFRENFFRWPFDLPVEAIQWFQILGENSMISAGGRTARIDFAPVKRRVCQHALTTSTVLADGRVTICSGDTDGKYTMGNIRESGIMEIWNSDLYKEFRRQHLRQLPCRDKPCKDCRDWYHPI